MLEYDFEELKELWYNLGKESIDISGYPDLVKTFRQLSPEQRSILNYKYQQAKVDLDINSSDFSQFAKKRYTRD